MRFRKIAAAVGLLGAVNASAQTARPRVFTPGDMAPEAPSVDVWLDQGSYGYGQPIRPSFASDPGAYVTIVRVTTDGEMRVMYPRRPDLQERYSPGRTVDTRISYAGSPTFNVYESRGTGFVFAIASYDAFDYSYFRIGSEWRTARLASSGRYGDPFEIIRMFIEQTLSERSDYSIDYVAYEVFSNTQRSRYSTRYHYSSFDDYFDRCLSAFGYRYSVYCGTYGSYYGPVVLAGPRSPAPNSPNAPREPAIRPLVPDPMLPTPPSLDPQQQVAGRFPARVSGEAAAAWRRERMLREASPRVEMKSGSTGAAEPRYIERPRAEPGVYREPMNAPVQRSEPAQRAEPMRRSEPRWEPRVMQAAPPPPPRAEPRPQPIQRIESPRSEASPAKAKDQI